MKMARQEDQSLDSSVRTPRWSLGLGTQSSPKKVLRRVGGRWAWHVVASTRYLPSITVGNTQGLFFISLCIGLFQPAVFKVFIHDHLVLGCRVGRVEGIRTPQ